ncbi:MAG: hypothetical protein A2W51_02025 [Candidatus Zambryskibacteria bacterium RIFCSPHIGHO2_02_39_10]|nr:MAG: hypothetical protein A2W51_02025 [Candidatus Zambryskibacteria bacterium RIFCSPHIGHO2_02_39_10]
MNKNLLMSYSEYSKIKHETPYFYIIKVPEHIIYYFGSSHSHEPSHQEFGLLKEKWDEFINETKNSKSVVILETSQIPEQETTIEKAIIKYGESGAGAYLAYINNLPLILGEPENSQVIDYLLNDYSKAEVLFWYQCQAIKFWQKNKKGRSIDEFLLNQTGRYRKLLNWSDLVISFDLINEIYCKLFNKKLDINDENIFSELTSPTVIKSRINELSRSQSQFRNEYILGQVEKCWNDGYNIFIIYGAGHAVMQELAIKSLAS